jgi:aminoglycoside 3-N-acetyltransferase
LKRYLDEHPGGTRFSTGSADEAATQAVSRAELVRQLQALGLSQGVVLVVHASFRAVRPVEGGPLGVIEALRDALQPEGTLMMPSMSGSRANEPYDPAVTTTRHMGIIAETFWKLPGTLRGDHPTSAFAAVGPKAAFLTRPQPLSPPHGPQSPIGWLRDLDGWVLLLGVDHSANTTIHLAEAMANVPYGLNKWTTLLQNGRPKRVVFRESDHCCRRFSLVEDWLQERGLQRTGPVGHAQARLMRSRDVVALVMERLVRDSTLFLCPPDVPCAECLAAWESVKRSEARSGKEPR